MFNFTSQSVKAGGAYASDTAAGQVVSPVTSQTASDTIASNATAICNMMEPPSSTECAATAADLAPVALTAAVVTVDDVVAVGAGRALKAVGKAAEKHQVLIRRLVASFNAASGSVKKVITRQIVKRIAMVIGTAAFAAVILGWFP